MYLLFRIIDLYALIVIAAVVLSWFRLPPHNPVVRILRQLTEPLLAPIRRALPALGGLDFSPMVLILGLMLLKRVLFSVY